MTFAVKVALGDTANFKKMNIFFEWIFGILKKWINFLMNILDFEKMNNFFEWIFWIFKKWIFVLNECSGFLKNE